eukprot:8138866-Lingulodinium_polyedra.AAC.1
MGEAGEVLPDAAVCRQRWQRHFATLLKGSPTDFVALLKETVGGDGKAFDSLAAGPGDPLQL